jgi:hypothetical protein
LAVERVAKAMGTWLHFWLKLRYNELG